MNYHITAAVCTDIRCNSNLTWLVWYLWRTIKGQSTANYMSVIEPSGMMQHTRHKQTVCPSIKHVDVWKVGCKNRCSTLSSFSCLPATRAQEIGGCRLKHTWNPQGLLRAKIDNWMIVLPENMIVGPRTQPSAVCFSHIFRRQRVFSAMPLLRSQWNVCWLNPLGMLEMY